METLQIKDALSVISERKSVRHYTGEPVSKEDLIKLLHAAMTAPSAMHMLPWNFVVINDREKLKKLEEGMPFTKMLVNAGTGIVVCATPGDAALGREEFSIIDCTCASENILLAAEALGLGAVWTAVYPEEMLMEFVRKVLDIPSYVIPLNLIPVGHPTGEDKAKNRSDPKYIHWNKW